MPQSRIRRYIPTRAQLGETKSLRPIAHLLTREELWHLNRRSAAGAVFIGLFCAFLPIPMQMVVAALFALVARCNLPIAVALVWITNPITIPPMFYFSYRLGAWLLDMNIEISSVDLDWQWLVDNFSSIGYPLLFGSLVCGWVAGVTGFVLTRVVWRLHIIKRWRERRLRRRLAQ